MSGSFWNRVKGIFTGQELPKSTKNDDIVTNDINAPYNKKRTETDQISDFSKILTEQNIELDVDLTSKNEVLQYLTKKASHADDTINAETVYGQYLTREKQASTNLLDGIAIPHIQSKSIAEMKLIIVRLSKPITWDETNMEVSVIISLLTPALDSDFSHVQYLASLAQILLKQKNVDILQQATDKADIMKLFNI